ncbi:60S ribosomal protein L28 [Haplosporangium bisporale]|nr:60S ribosomal protein L28 [Haplosporangium bisporale]
MSADLTWLLIKNNNSFLIKRSGVQFSAEAGNLLNKNSFKYSGLANNKVYAATTVSLTVKHGISGCRRTILQDEFCETAAIN